MVARSNATPLPGRLPLDQRADGPPSRRPSRRADEPPSAQAPGIRAALVRTDPKGRSRRAPRVRCQDSAVSRRSPPLIAHSLTRLAICSGQKSHPGFCRRNRNHPGSGRSAITLTRSDHPTTTGESAPSVMTPTPKSPHANAWYGDAPVLQSPDGRYDDTSASCPWGPHRPASPKDRTQNEPQGSEQARGVPGVGRSGLPRARFGHESPRIAMACHEFTILASHFRARVVDTPKKKPHLGSWLSQRDP